MILALLVLLLFSWNCVCCHCKQERSVCYLLRLSKNRAFYSVRRRSTQSKQIRKMYFHASFIKSIIISIYSLATSTISSHLFLFLIIFNQWYKKSSRKISRVIGSFQKNVLMCGSLEHQKEQEESWDQNLLINLDSEQWNSSQVIQQQLNFCHKPYVYSKYILVCRRLSSRTWPHAESINNLGRPIRLVSEFRILWLCLSSPARP